MKYKFPLLALVFILLGQSINAQVYDKIPRWGIRGGLAAFLTSETNQGPGILTILGPSIDLNLFDSGLAAMNVRSGLLFLNGGDGSSIGFPLELDLMIHNDVLGFIGGLGIIRQSGEAVWEEKSTIPTFHLSVQFMRPNHSFYWRLEFRSVRLSYHEYFNNQWTHSSKGGGGGGIGVSFGGFLGKWKSTELK